MGRRLERHRPEALGALFTADGTYTDHAISVTMTGREQISGWKARTDSMIDDVHVTITAYRAGDHVTIEAVYAGTSRAPRSRSPSRWPPCSRPVARITSDQDYYSLSSVLAQSGLPADWTPDS